MIFRNFISREDTTALRPLFLKAFLWNHAAKVAEYLFLYIFSLVVARKLGPSTNGIYATLSSVAGLLLIASSAGFDQALNKFLPAISREAGAESALRSIVRQLAGYKVILLAIFGLLLAAGWHLAAGWIDLPGAPREYLVFIIAVGSARAITSLLASVWVSEFRPKVPFVINTSIPLLQICALLWLSAGTLRLSGVLMIVLAGSLASLGATIAASRGYLRPAEKRADTKEVLRFSRWLWLHTVMLYVLGKQGDILLLSLFAVAKSTIGAYEVGFTVSQLPGFFLAAGMGGISMAMFSKVATETPTGVAKFWRQVTGIFTKIMIPLYCFLFVFAREFITLLYSDAYRDSGFILQILILSRIAARLFSGGENFDTLIALGRERLAVMVYLAGGVLNLALALILIPSHGITGAAVATGIALIFNDCASWVALRRHAGVSFQFPLWASSVIVGLFPALLIRAYLPTETIAELALYFILCTIVWVPASAYLSPGGAAGE